MKTLGLGPKDSGPRHCGSSGPFGASLGAPGRIPQGIWDQRYYSWGWPAHPESLPFEISLSLSSQLGGVIYGPLLFINRHLFIGM